MDQWRFFPSLFLETYTSHTVIKAVTGGELKSLSKEPNLDSTELLGLEKTWKEKVPTWPLCAGRLTLARPHIFHYYWPVNNVSFRTSFSYRALWALYSRFQSLLSFIAMNKCHTCCFERFFWNVVVYPLINSLDLDFHHKSGISSLFSRERKKKYKRCLTIRQILKRKLVI